MELDGAVTFRPSVACENKGRIMRWLILKPCVTEGSAISVTCEMLAALGVPTKNDCPYATAVGAELIVGREPWNRYGGEYISAEAPPAGSPPADKTRPSGNNTAVEWYARAFVKLAIVVHVPVAGSHSSLAYAGSVGIAFGPSVPLLPPVTKTLPSGSNVTLWSLRPPVTIDPV